MRTDVQTLRHWSAAWGWHERQTVNPPDDSLEVMCKASALNKFVAGSCLVICMFKSKAHHHGASLLKCLQVPWSIILRCYQKDMLLIRLSPNTNPGALCDYVIYISSYSHLLNGRLRNHMFHTPINFIHLSATHMRAHMEWKIGQQK